MLFMPKQKKEKKSLLEMDVPFGGVSLIQKVLFAKHLAVMLKSGLPITEAISIAQDSARGKLKKVLGGVLKSVMSGRPLSSSFENYPKVFSGLFVNATYAGEQSGTLEDNLSHVAEQLEKEKELVSKVKGAMLYPIVVLSAAFILGLAMAFLVLPKIVPLFEGLKMDLPITTRALIKFSHLIQDHGLALFLGIIIFVALIIWLAKQKFSRPVTHWLLLSMPIIKRITRNVNLARFCRILGTLIKSGINIDEALEITQKTVGNYYYQKCLAQVSKRIGKGTKLSDNLAEFEKFFPLIVIKMIRVGEESGKLEDTLLYLAGFYEAEVDTATKTLATAIEPVLLIFIGLIVAILVLSIITPIYKITGGVRR